MTARRKPTHRAVCAEEGCHEAAFYEYDRISDMRDHLKRLAKSPWKCTRHSDPGKTLSPSNRERTTALTATRGEGIISNILFWHNGTSLGSGFTFGPGFNAHASDFPEGTRLIITARIEMPS